MFLSESDPLGTVSSWFYSRAIFSGEVLVKLHIWQYLCSQETPEPCQGFKEGDHWLTYSKQERREENE